jgi:hypothetical protein
MKEEDIEQGVNSILGALKNENLKISNEEIEKHLSKLLDEKIYAILKNQSAVFTIEKLQAVVEAFKGDSSVDRQPKQNRKSRKLPD